LNDADLRALRLRLLQVLAAPSYDPIEPLATADWFRLSYAELLADEGRTGEAIAIVRTLKVPGTLMRASVDARFKDAFPSPPDVRAAYEALVTEGREAIVQHPGRLSPLLETAAALRELGRFDESATLLLSVRDRVQKSGSFEDSSSQLNWYHDGLGRSLAAQGRYDEAVASFRAGAALGENGGLNVSQLINLAHAQLAYGRGDDALKTLAAFEGANYAASPYGESELRLARGCAKVVAGRPAEAQAELAYLRDHDLDHPEALSGLLLCLGDLDGAAALFVRRLDDPKRRVQALLQLSDYDPPPAHEQRNPIFVGLANIKTRADLREAIARAGGVRRFKVQPGAL
jgi:tetratricopeptide (TPR) repeat protein